VIVAVPELIKQIAPDYDLRVGDEEFDAYDQSSRKDYQAMGPSVAR
jgi:hypothetical protein